MNALLLFVKNPQLGHVKTRLAATIGPELALEVYLYLMQHTREVTMQLPVERWLFYSQAIQEEDAWPSESFHKLLQAPSRDLGQKMFDAFRQAQQAGLEKVLILGSDCFQITPDMLVQAFEQLDHVPVVLGPATDGGYYGLGVNFKAGITLKHLETFFLNKTWSHERVAQEAREAFQACLLKWAELPTLSDVDIEDDIAPIRSHFTW
jgi:uncharacterized protein